MRRKNLTPIKAIRAFCLQCTSSDRAWIKECPSLECPLYPYRMGTNPNVSEHARMDAAKRAKSRNSDKKQGL